MCASEAKVINLKGIKRTNGAASSRQTWQIAWTRTFVGTASRTGPVPVPVAAAVRCFHARRPTRLLAAGLCGRAANPQARETSIRVTRRPADNLCYRYVRGFVRVRSDRGPHPNPITPPPPPPQPPRSPSLPTRTKKGKKKRERTSEWENVVKSEA